MAEGNMSAAVLQALQSVKNAEETVKDWNDFVMRNAFNSDVRGWASERLDHARADLRQANEFLLQLIQLQLPSTVPVALETNNTSIVNIAAERRRKDAQDRSSSVTKRARRGLHEAMSQRAKDLREKINAFDSAAIDNINTVVSLPFPSLGIPPYRFQVVKGYFQYQPRTDLKVLYDKVKRFWHAAAPIKVQVVGTVGYGTSHMLAVLALLLFKDQPKDQFDDLPWICYIPHCRDSLTREDEVVTIMQQNILLNFPDFDEPIGTFKEIREVMQRQSVILVADQWNSTDDDDDDVIRQARTTWIDECLGTSPCVTIYGLSMNAKRWTHLVPIIQHSGDRNMYYGGFQDNEFEVWLGHHPKIFTEHKDELALLTGKVPLLLSVFERTYNLDPSVSWEQVLQRVQKDSVLQDWKCMLTKFYRNVDRERVWKVLTRSVDWYADTSIIDHRFFYTDKKYHGIRATSEIVLRFLYSIWSKKGAYDTIPSTWRHLFFRTPYESAGGFYVEQIIKAQICRNGVVGIHPLPNNQTIRRCTFEHGAEQAILEVVMGTRDGVLCWFLLDPEMFNYPGVDMILVTDNTVLGINVTIAQTHSSLEPFFTIWRPLAEQRGLNIRGLFIAPNGFQHQEENVDTIFLKDVYNELWY